MALLVFGEAIESARALTIGDLVPYGAAAGDVALPRGDDTFLPITLGTSGLGGTPLSIDFYGSEYSSLWVNTNGVISLGQGIFDYTPRTFPIDLRTPIIAPLWGDADTRFAPSGQVWYRTTTDTSQLAAIAQSMSGASTPPALLYATVVTWDQIGFYNGDKASDKFNTFQALIVSDGITTQTIFNYPDGGINWLRGSSNPAISFPSAGLDAGNGVNYVNLPGAGTAGVVNLTAGTNTGELGQWIYSVDGKAPVFNPADSNVAPRIWQGGSGEWSTGARTNWDAGSPWDSTGTVPSSALFSAATGLVTVATPVTASRIIVEGASTTFTATSAANSLSFYALEAPANGEIVARGSLGLIAKGSYGIDPGMLFSLKDASSLTLAATNAMTSGGIALSDTASLKIGVDYAIRNGVSVDMGGGDELLSRWAYRYDWEAGRSR